MADQAADIRPGFAHLPFDLVDRPMDRGDVERRIGTAVIVDHQAVAGLAHADAVDVADRAATALADRECQLV